ncbi:MAG: redoxin domain-containing protein [Gemmatimonadales bacterium]|nr:redoxin domain-containing protein [Gemmatimonadales bacterium]
MTTPKPVTLLTAALLTASALIAALTRRYDDLRKAYADQRMRLALPYPGLLLPTIGVAMAEGDSVNIGRMTDSTGKQLIFVFTTTCRFCKATVPLWRELADSIRFLKGGQVQVVGLSLDSPEATHLFGATFDLDFPVGVLPPGKDRQLLRAVMVPQTLVLDHEGRVMFARTGVFSSQSAIDSVYQALAWTPDRRPERKEP